MERLKNKRVAIDSMLLIYLLEADSSYRDRVGMLLEQAGQIVCSSFLLAEVCAGFYRAGEEEKVEMFRRFIEDNGIEVLPFDENQALIFAKIRGENRFSPSDCIHLAAAVSGNVDFFVTNDKALKNFDGLVTVQLADL